MKILSTIVAKTHTPQWISNIYISVVFFVVGQVLLKKSFTNNTDYVGVSVAFGIAFGITALTLLLFEKGTNNRQLFTNKSFNNQLAFAISSGILFFIGNLFWIRALSSNQPLGNIRVVMAGVETIALFATGVLFFNESITFKQLLGSTIIITGIHIFGSK